MPREFQIIKDLPSVPQGGSSPDARRPNPQEDACLLRASRTRSQPRCSSATR